MLRVILAVRLLGRVGIIISGTWHGGWYVRLWILWPMLDLGVRVCLIQLLSVTAKQWHTRNQLHLGWVSQYCSLYYIPSCSRSHPPFLSPFPCVSPSHSPSHCLHPSLTQSLCHRPACSPHCRHHHWHCRCKDHAFRHSKLRDPPSSVHHQPCRLSYRNSVV